MKYGFIKVAAAVPTIKVADCQQNVVEIESLIAQAEGKGVEIIVFPELCITGYTCQDLFQTTILVGRGRKRCDAVARFHASPQHHLNRGTAHRGRRPAAKLRGSDAERQNIGNRAQDLPAQLQ